MIRLFEKLYEFADIDLRAAKVLTEDKLFAPAIYHYQRCFEKCNKSIIASYLTLHDKKASDIIENELRKISHKVTQATVDVISNLMNFDKEQYIKRGGRETDDFIQNAYNMARSLNKHIYGEIELVHLFPGIVIGTYNTAFLRLREKRCSDTKEPMWEYLRKTFERKETAYLKYNIIAWIISPVLEQMDTYTRYPLKSVSYLNLSSLTHPRCKEACYMLGDMLNELFCLVPLVWNRIKSMSNS